MIEALHAVLAPRCAAVGLTPEMLLWRDAPGGLGAPGRISPNRFCHILQSFDGWVALNLARVEDQGAVPALTGFDAPMWESVAAAAAQESAASFRDRAAELQLPCAVVGEAAAVGLADLGGASVPRQVLDLSALWAGPLCAGLLGAAGAAVVRVESVGRPDPTKNASPGLFGRVNAGKVQVSVDFRDAAGRQKLLGMASEADVIVASARPRALAKLGLTPENLTHVKFVAITAHGWSGAGADRVGFGDDCAAAGGLVRREGGVPLFAGDALADPLTGLEAALAVLAAPGPGLLDMPMAGVAAAYAQVIRCG